MAYLMKRIVLGAAVAALPWVHVAQGGVLIDQNFDSLALGNSIPFPPTPPSNVVWKYLTDHVAGTSPSGTTVDVVGPVGTNLTQSAQLFLGADDDPSDGTTVGKALLGADWAAPVTSGLLNVKFSLRSSNLPNVGHVIFIGGTWDTGNMVTGFYTGGADLYAFTRDGDEGQVNLGQLLVTDTWAEFEVAANLDAKTFQLFKDGTAVGTPLGFIGGGHWADGTGSAREIQIISDSANNNVNAAALFVDKLQVVSAPVPEPASLGLVAAGGALLLGRRRARKV
jgi:hypothetical protein